MSKNIRKYINVADIMNRNPSRGAEVVNETCRRLEEREFGLVWHVGLQFVRRQMTRSFKRKHLGEKSEFCRVHRAIRADGIERKNEADKRKRTTINTKEPL